MKGNTALITNDIKLTLWELYKREEALSFARPYIGRHSKLVDMFIFRSKTMSRLCSAISSSVGEVILKSLEYSASWVHFHDWLVIKTRWGCVTT